MRLEEIQNRALIRVVDDDPDLLEATELMLTCAGWHCRTYSSAKAFLIGDSPSQPGCLILDIRMPEMTGTELQAELNARGIELPVIVLTGHANLDIAVAAFRAGACDFLQKPVNEDELLEVIARASEQSLLGSFGLPNTKEMSRRLSSLTDREGEVCRLMRLGLGVAEISERLGITDHTVYLYRSRIYQKLGTRDISLIGKQTGS